MSKIGKNPIILPAGVKVSLDALDVKAEGPKGTLTKSFKGPVSITQEDNTIVVTNNNSSKFSRSMWGTVRQIVNNMVEGVNNGFEKKLQIEGVGYKAAMKGNTLSLSLGHSHPVEVTPEEGISLKVEGNIITVSGIDKERVGKAAAEIRDKRKPDPYKGKGVRYVGEVLKLKEGKKA